MSGYNNKVGKKNFLDLIITESLLYAAASVLAQKKKKKTKEEHPAHSFA